MKLVKQAVRKRYRWFREEGIKMAIARVVSEARRKRKGGGSKIESLQIMANRDLTKLLKESQRQAKQGKGTPLRNVK